MYSGIKILFSFFVLGFCLMPTLSYACGTMQDSIKKQERTAIASTKIPPSDDSSSCESGNCATQCCDTKTDKPNQNDCEGKCGGVSCSTVHAPVYCSVDLSYCVNTSQIGIALGGSSFYYQNPIYSFELQNIWQPPKIG